MALFILHLLPLKNKMPYALFPYRVTFILPRNKSSGRTRYQALEQMKDLRLLSKLGKLVNDYMSVETKAKYIYTRKMLGHILMKVSLSVKFLQQL